MLTTNILALAPKSCLILWVAPPWEDPTESVSKVSEPSRFAPALKEAKRDASLRVPDMGPM